MSADKTPRGPSATELHQRAVYAQTLRQDAVEEFKAAVTTPTIRPNAHGLYEEAVAKLKEASRAAR